MNAKPLSPELIDAVHKGDIERVKQLKAEGHDLNLLDPDEGEDLLYHGAWVCGVSGDLTMIQQLLDLGCVPSNVPCQGGTPLISAVWSHNPKMVEMLLNAGADPNVLGLLEDGPTTALDAALGDYCACYTDEDVQAMEAIEALIRAAGGKTNYELTAG